MHTVRTPGFTLEPLTVAHAARMFQVLSDPAIYEFENEPPPSVAWLTDRYRRLATRRSPDGTEQWLNWAVRLPDGDLAGYVQATVLPSGTAAVAYELASRHWGRGLGSAAVQAMLDELQQHHGARTFVAVLKSANFRSAALLRRLGFVAAGAEQAVCFGAAGDEMAMFKPARPASPGDGESPGHG